MDADDQDLVLVPSTSTSIRILNKVDRGQYLIKKNNDFDTGWPNNNVNS